MTHNPQEGCDMIDQFFKNILLILSSVKYITNTICYILKIKYKKATSKSDNVLLNFKLRVAEG